ncbi:MAG: ribosome-binding factor A [Minisyncoccia bacterium]
MASLIQNELGMLILREFEFPALITITNLKIDSEFKTATAKIKIIFKDIKTPKNKELQILKELNQNKEKFFKILLKKLNLKPLPKIQFELDK